MFMPAKKGGKIPRTKKRGLDSIFFGGQISQPQAHLEDEHREDGKPHHRRCGPNWGHIFRA